MRLFTAAASLALGLSSSALLAAPTPLTLEPFVGGLASPTEIAQPDDGSGRLFVVEQAGTIRVVRNGVLLPTPFLDISQAAGGSVLAGGEQGLLGLAFDPDYVHNGRFYVDYTRVRSDIAGSDIVVERYTRSATDPDVADPASASLVLLQPHPTFPNHNGGKLAFGPDGFLYVGIGDGGGGGDPLGAAESLTDLRGKLLRLDVSGAGGGYAIPPSNPFAVANPNAPARPEIWAYGLRNPWRFSFDRATGDVFIGDVGQNLWEEIDFQPAGIGGRDYGWSTFEGMHCFNPSTNCSRPGSTLPILEHFHDANGGFAIIGGFRYRGSTLPALEGYYVYGDAGTGHIWAAAPDNSGNWTTTVVANTGEVSTFGQDVSGELYVANLSDGTISRLTPAATTLPRAVNLSTRARVGTGNDVLIGGFIIGGDGPKTVVVTGAGPSLQSAGVASPLPNPRLTIVRQSPAATVIATNDDWQDGPDAARIADAGFGPADSREPAVMLTLQPGAYTAILEDAGGATGAGVVGVFEVDHPEVPLIDIATRGNVLGGDDVLIGGFVIQGDAPRTVVITATGPSLFTAGITNPLQNPALTLVRSSDQSIIATNAGWQNAANAAEIEQAGFAPADMRESAIMATLAPGAYTAIASGVSGTTGVAVVAVYEIGP